MPEAIAGGIIAGIIVLLGGVLLDNLKHRQERFERKKLIYYLEELCRKLENQHQLHSHI